MALTKKNVRSGEALQPGRRGDRSPDDGNLATAG
jgi:hypothetical protein